MQTPMNADQLVNLAISDGALFVSVERHTKAFTHYAITTAERGREVVRVHNSDMRTLDLAQLAAKGTSAQLGK